MGVSASSPEAEDLYYKHDGEVAPCHSSEDIRVGLPGGKRSTAGLLKPHEVC
jgi:hypothetical protein